MELLLRAGTPPVDADVPTTLAEWLEFIENYMAIEPDSGSLDDLSVVVRSDTQPGVDSQDAVWAELSQNGRLLGLKGYSGAWLRMPVIPPSRATADLPADPQVGEMHVRTDRQNAIEIYRSGAWDAAIPGRGTTAQRPTSVPNGYQYHDTDIDRLLKWNSANSAWTTVDGFVGQIVETDLDLSTALTRNPGWVEYTAGAGRFLRGADGTIAVGATGGRDEFTIAVTRGQDNKDNGVDSNWVTQVAVDGTSPGSTSPLPGDTTEVDVPIIPSCVGVTRLKKSW